MYFRICDAVMFDAYTVSLRRRLGVKGINRLVSGSDQIGLGLDHATIARPRPKPGPGLHLELQDQDHDQDLLCKTNTDIVIFSKTKTKVVDTRPRPCEVLVFVLHFLISGFRYGWLYYCK